MPLQRGSNPAGTTQQARTGNPGQHHDAGAELPGPRALGIGMRTEDPDGIRIVLAEVPCRSPPGAVTRDRRYRRDDEPPAA